MVRHFCLIVKDLEKSIKFYQDYFQMELFKQDTLSLLYSEKLFNIPGIKIRYAKLIDRTKEGKILELIETNKKIGSHIAFTVSDIDELYEDLKDKVKFSSKPFKALDGKVRLCYLNDPDGNGIELVQD